jgi:hypothetical protein
MNTIKFVSVWDDNIEIKSDCQYDEETKVVSEIEVVEANGLEICHDEYVLLSDGTEIRDFIIE